MIKTVTFGYRWEGLMLHQWAFTHTNLQAVVLPGNRLDDHVSKMVKDWCDYVGAPLLVQASYGVNLVLERDIEEYKPDLIVCCCYSLKVPDEILSIARFGGLNIHPGDLPKYAGARPIEAALNSGNKNLWVTLHEMTDKFDSGEIRGRAWAKRDENLQRIKLRLTELGLNLLEQELGL